jgi:hypothetical protein
LLAQAETADADEQDGQKLPEEIASLATRALNSALRRLLFRLLIWFYFGLVALKNQLFSLTRLWLRFEGPLQTIRLMEDSLHGLSTNLK